MKGIREIKTRIKAIKSTSQITKAMQLIAAFKMKRSQQMLIANRPYALLFEEILSSAFAQLEPDSIQHPLIGERPIRSRGILVISTDRGLCGALNSNLFRLIQPIESSAKFVTIGRKASQYLHRTNRSILADFQISDAAHFSEIRLVIEYMLECYINNEIDTIEVLYPHFVNVLKQDSCLDKLVPILNVEEALKQLGKRINNKNPDTTADNDKRLMLFEPDAKTILDNLIPLFVKYELYERLLEARASENSARMVAMKNATDNAEQLLSDLTLEYNKARQAAITQEIVEIAGASLNQT
jgi:F-type H+-transporting ATPase subunit gamma